MGGTRSAGGATASGGAGPAMMSSAGGAGFDAAAEIRALEPSDRRLYERTIALMGEGIRPAATRDAAEAMGRDAAQAINESGPSVGYTVYGSTWSGFQVTQTGIESKIFAGVAYGSGESRGSMQRGQAQLRLQGYKTRIYNDETFKGIVVSR